MAWDSPGGKRAAHRATPAQVTLRRGRVAYWFRGHYRGSWNSPPTESMGSALAEPPFSSGHRVAAAPPEGAWQRHPSRRDNRRLPEPGGRNETVFAPLLHRRPAG